MMKTTLPRRIIRYRELHGLTQQRLAKLARISPSTLNELESGLANDVKLSTIGRICLSLEITPGILLADNLIAGDCPVCGGRFPSWHFHTVGECIMSMHDASRPTAWIASRAGLSPSSIEQILKDEYTVRRLRRYPAPSGSGPSGSDDCSLR
jgi:DNA-binding XRE family transcriptional regulator